MLKYLVPLILLKKGRGLKQSRRALTVEEVMSFPILTVSPDESVQTAVVKMVEHDISSLIVVDEEGRDIGIITERDVIEKVVAKDRDPKSVKVKEIMSNPLKKISSDSSIIDALEKMRRSRIKKLGVEREGRLVGIVSERDLVYAIPAMYELVEATSRERLRGVVKKEVYEGFCEECGIWSDSLNVVEGRLLCEDCMEDIRLASED
ncbi:MAG: CBS domain-containing protein [Candidatus Brockarchaeota archaeon]|nr:CBS domain-containing protein [Candidatus Brockarchaeota archaeon]